MNIERNEPGFSVCNMYGILAYGFSHMRLQGVPRKIKKTQFFNKVKVIENNQIIMGREQILRRKDQEMRSKDQEIIQRSLEAQIKTNNELMAILQKIIEK